MIRRLVSLTFQCPRSSINLNLRKNPHPSPKAIISPLIFAQKEAAGLRFYCSQTSFESTSDETLESLCEHLETIIDDNPKLSEADVTLASGVLTLVLPNPFGTYVINKQSPNKQIWLSSPQSGPFRYDLEDSAWIYKHSQESLHELLNKEIGENILGLQDAGFEDLYCGRRRTPSEK